MDQELSNQIEKIDEALSGIRTIMISYLHIDLIINNKDMGDLTKYIEIKKIVAGN